MLKLFVILLLLVCLVCCSVPALAESASTLPELPKYTDRLTEANWHWQECPGVHNFDIWYLGLFNFLRILNN